MRPSRTALVAHSQVTAIDRAKVALPAKKLMNSTPMPAKKKATSRRELIAPKGDKRFVRRTSAGTFGKTVAVGKSLSADARTTAKKKVPKGQGDRGDTRR